jgi:hypothetical protein
MRSGKHSEEVVWLTDGVKTYAFKETKTHTMTAYGDKTEISITVFHSPMPEAIQAVQSRMQQPSRKKRMEKASGIVNHAQHLFNYLVNARFKKKTDGITAES